MEDINIKDVAKRAGVSVKTVSRVINNHKYVSLETRKKVWEAIEELGYVPSEEGKKLANLKKKKYGKLRTGNIGVILFPSYNKYSEPHFAEVLEEIDRVLLELNMHCYFTYTLRELEDNSLFLKMINPNYVDGCIFIGGEQYRGEIERIRKRIKNLLILCDYIKDDSISCVYADGFNAGYIATKYLIEKGHRDIGCITGHLDWPEYSQLRFLGYKKALKEEGIVFREEYVREGKYSIEGAYNATISLLKENPSITAIFVVSDPMAIGVYKGIEKMDLKIPEDISVISIDNIRLSEHLAPPLTTVGWEMYEMVKRAILTLIDEIEEKSKPGVRIVFPVKLIERQSVKLLKEVM
jgi:DNA-binding LacI/PurR family transcriptional regulator